MLLGLGLLGVILFFTQIPGSFLIDECNYLVTLTGLRQGQLSVPGTASLQPSRSLLYFDPTARARAPLRSPATSTAPPLYAVLAYPFGLFGWQGLVALNILSFLACALLVFYYAGKYARLPRTPYLALATFLFGGYCLEYAQGVWPHMLSMLLCMGSLVLASEVRASGSTRLALAAGLLAGLATGVRYPNLILAAMVGTGLMLWSPNRLKTSGAFGLGLLVPLGASSVINRLRHGWWSPVSKGSYYFNFVHKENRLNRLLEALWVLWAKVVDFSFHTPRLYMIRQPHSGAYMLHVSIKKAWLQSCPWLAAALVSLGMSWRGGGAVPGRRQELRAICLAVAGVLCLFAVAGFKRTDGFCYNQRYFLDLMPMMAVVLAWTAERVAFRYWPLAAGCLAGAVLAGSPFLLDPGSTLRQVTLLRLPLGLGLMLLIAWALAHRDLLRPAFSFIMGACLVWSLTVHLLDDLRASRVIRARKLSAAQMMERQLPEGPVGVLAQCPTVIAFCPLQMKRDMVLADTALDRGKHTTRLVEELLSDGRRVFLYSDQYYPRKILNKLRTRRVLKLKKAHLAKRIWEILPQAP